MAGPQPPTYQIVELSGPPQQIGQQMAQLLRHTPSPFRRNPWEDDMGFLARCSQLLRSLWEPLWLELAAYAEAQQLPSERGLFVRGAPPMGCSAVAWQLPDGRIIAGRNYDFYERMPTRHLLLTNPSKGYAHLGMNGGLVGGRYDGVNEHGLFVALHKVMADKPRDFQPGVPYHLVLRLALEMCSNAEDAAALLAELPHLAPFNYTFADARGTLIKLECYPGMPTAMRHSSGTLAVANNYEHPPLAALQGSRPQRSSLSRLERMRCVPEQDHWDGMRDVLSDHDSDMCTHREFSTTLWSARFDLTAQRVEYAFGPPCSTPFTALAWPGRRAGERKEIA